MKLFLKKILIFVFPICLFVVGMDFYLESMSSSWQEKLEGLRKEANEIEVLILGNSHAGCGVNPDAFTNYYVYNIAKAGQSIYFDKELTLQNLDTLKRLKYVLISLDYHSLYFSSQRGKRNIWSYYGNNIKHPSTSYYKADISPFLLGYNPKVSFSLIRKDLLAKWKFGKQPYFLDIDTRRAISTTKLVNGFFHLPSIELDVFDENNYITRINGHHKLIKNSTEEELVLTELNELINTLHRKEITPIFFSAPTFKDYNMLLDPDIINRNNVITKKLCKKYNMEYWDYAINNDFLKNEFYNPDHLNKKGAARFSKILDSRLLKK